MTDPTTPVPSRKGRGCLYYGCMTVLVLFLLACLAAFFAFRWVRNEIIAFTDTAPMNLPKVEMAETDLKGLELRVKTFADALDRGKPVEPLTLTERDLNALMTLRPDMKKLADKVYVSLEDNKVKGQVSFPLGRLGWIARGRYFNGQATFKVSLQNGVLIVTADEIKVKGTPLPEVFMKEVRKENLAKDAYRDAKSAETISKLDSIEVQDGRAIIKARAVKPAL